MTKSSLVESKIEKKVFSKCGNPGCWTCSNCRERFTSLFKQELKKVVGKKRISTSVYDHGCEDTKQEILDKIEKL